MKNQDSIGWERKQEKSVAKHTIDLQKHSPHEHMHSTPIKTHSGATNLLSKHSLSIRGYVCQGSHCTLLHIQRY